MQNIKIKWFGYCAPTNKFWGWFDDNKYDIEKDIYRLSFCYCFWGYVDKNINFNKKRYDPIILDRLIAKKIKNNYSYIDDVDYVFSNFNEKFENAYVLLKLSED